MTKDIDPKLKSISEYLNIDEKEKFVIPIYQRAYAWDTTKCDKLWQDINDYLYNNYFKDPYFFGTIIVNCSMENGELNLIDGQQRTTSFLLLLKALLVRLNEVISKFHVDEDSEELLTGLKRRRESLFEILYKVEAEKVQKIVKDWSSLDKKIMIENRSFNENKNYKDELNTILFAETYDEAESKVYKIPKKQKDNKYTHFFRNFKFFYDKIDEFDDSQLNSFTKTLLEKCQIIEIRSWNEEQAIKMFNSLNSTGLPLSDADIISSELFSRTREFTEEELEIEENKERDRKKFEELWKVIIDDVNTLYLNKIVDINDVMQEYMYICRAKDGDYNVTTPGVKRYFVEINNGILAKPISLCEAFNKIINIWLTVKDYPIIKLLLKFNENAKMYLVSYLYRFSIDEIDEIKVNQISECLIKLFAMIELVDAGYSSKKFKSFLFEENIKLVNPNVSIDEIVNDFNAHLNNVNNWEKDDIKKRILEYNGNILVFLNEYVYIKEHNKKYKDDKSEILVFDFDPSVNIEHIMPQSGSAYESIRIDAGMDKEEFDTYINCLGNKILLEEEINKSIGKIWFEFKRTHSIKSKTKDKGYIDSKYAIAKQLADKNKWKKDTWDKEDIISINNKISERLINFIFNK